MDAIALTDNDWFRHLQELQPAEPVNFWTPTGWYPKKMESGDRLYFLLRSPVRKVGGFGRFKEFRTLNAREAWKEFGERNGVSSSEEMLDRLREIRDRRDKDIPNPEEHEIGCIVLRDAEFWPEDRFAAPENEVGMAVHPRVVTFKYIQPDGVSDGGSGVEQAFRLFQDDRLESLRVRVRRYRANEIRQLLRTGELDPETFDTEVWQLAASATIGGEEFADEFQDGVAPSNGLLDQVEEALEQGALDLQGNFHWRPGTRVFGAQFGAERRRESLDRALEILHRGAPEPLKQFQDLLDVPGFGPSTASGLVMLMHPDDFAVYNKKSKEGLRKLGGEVGTIEEFQQSASSLRDQVEAEDFSELDRFVYLVAEDRIFVPGSKHGWPDVWWVNQGASYQQEKDGSFVWAPTENKNGTTLRYHENVTRMSLGDRVLHYAKGALRAVGTVVGSPVVQDRPDSLPSGSWQKEGFYAGVDYDVLDAPIELDRIPPEWRLKEEDGPFTKNGSVQQGYLFPLSEEFARNVVSRFDDLQERFPMVAVKEKPAGPAPVLDLTTVCSDFGDKVWEAGLRFGDRDRHEDFVRSFVVSLATKQLVILTGLSGSGKTQIAVQFGRWLGEDHYKVVPVRPDWTGAEALFGYEDALREPKEGRKAWHVPEPLKFMLRAARDPENPYLMVLDEMNLAHVERYFADVISGMESEEPCLPNLQEEDGTWRQVPGEEEPAKIEFPDNLFIAGTVNVDETTYMFSPKVLDRANTMEFRVRTEDLDADLRKPGECEPGETSLTRGFLEIARDEDYHREHPPEQEDDYFRALKNLHACLDQAFTFGHRVVYEAIRFAALHEEAGGESMEEALDTQVLQKILPRLHGSRRQLEPVLETVGKFCWDLEPGDGDNPGSSFDPVDHAADEAALPRSFDKVRRMTERLRTNQFVSFTE